tara:strand:- start:568 stop:885 length:318 start_codon:yes stop_codon:yes gene_type:complete
MNESTVEVLCGPYPDNFSSEEIASNSNFIFVNDPSYESVTLFDLEENAATVNSFLECEHYVSGGWNYIPSEGLSEYFLQTSLTAISLIGIFMIYFSFNKLFKSKL